MFETTKLPKTSSSIKRYAWAVAGVWTATISLVLVWHLGDAYRNTLRMAHYQANISFEKDVVYRRWSAGHGGVYVPVSEKTPPNPYLSHLPNRDVTTTSGLELTLVNPAYMTRQVHELGLAQYGHQGHITSLNPLRPENAADPWETEALRAIAGGETEVFETSKIGDQPYARLMRPLITEASCLKCHAEQGYQVGDLRGGVSVSVPLAPLWAITVRHMAVIVMGYGLIGLLGLAGIGWSSRRIVWHVAAHDRAEQALQDREHYYRTLIHSLHEDIIVIDPDYQIVDVNDTFLKTTGFSREQVIGRPCFEITHQCDVPCRERDGHTCRLREVFQSGEVAYCQHVHVAADGSPRNVQIGLSPLKNAAGEITHVIEAARDISELVQGQAEREQLLQTMTQRVNELQCTHRVVESVRRRDTLEQVFRDVLALIPPAWMHHEITRVRIRFGQDEYVSEPFESTPWKQTENIIIHGETCGEIEVYYLQERPARDEGPFSTEERALLNSIAQTLSESIEHHQAEMKLKEQLDHQEDVVRNRTSELRSLVSMMAGRESRMAGLKDVVKALRVQIKQAGMTPVTDDPLMGEADPNGGRGLMEAEDDTTT